MAHHNHRGRRPPLRGNTLIKALRVARWVAVGLIAACALVLVLGLLVQWLWNAVVSDVFGVKLITYWQALGLAILAKLLFGGLGSRRHVTAQDSGTLQGTEDTASVQPPPCPSDYERYWHEEGRAAFVAYLQRQEQAKQNTEPE